MKYIYYPGCSLEGTAREYDQSVRAVMKATGAELLTLDDWTCCGASAAHATGRLLSLALAARNLALAEGMAAAADILVPCSACYLNLQTVACLKDAADLKRINEVLAADNLQWQGTGRVRHFLDVLANDVGSRWISDQVITPLSDLVIAPYYGCQCLRPFAVFDDPQAPKSMEPVIEALGARVHPWDMGPRCCGAANMNTKSEVGVALTGAILKAAAGADAIVTVCPMCQMNLEAYQAKISKRYEEALQVTILYLPQLVGLALGIPAQALGLQFNLAVTERFRGKLKEVTHNVVA